MLYFIRSLSMLIIIIQRSHASAPSHPKLQIYTITMQPLRDAHITNSWYHAHLNPAQWHAKNQHSVALPSLMSSDLNSMFGVQFWIPCQVSNLRISHLQNGSSLLSGSGTPH